LTYLVNSAEKVIVDYQTLIVSRALHDVFNDVTFAENLTIPIFTRESSYCFQRVLAIAILSVRPSVCPSQG